MLKHNIKDWVGGRERGFARCISSAGKIFENLFFFKAKDQGQKQMIRDWASFWEQAIV